MLPTVHDSPSILSISRERIELRAEWGQTIDLTPIMKNYSKGVGPRNRLLYSCLHYRAYSHNHWSWVALWWRCIRCDNVVCGFRSLLPTIHHWSVRSCTARACAVQEIDIRRQWTVVCDNCLYARTVCAENNEVSRPTVCVCVCVCVCLTCHMSWYYI